MERVGVRDLRQNLVAAYVLVTVLAGSALARAAG
jgi:hypothetical protein